MRARRTAAAVGAGLMVLLPGVAGAASLPGKPVPGTGEITVVATPADAKASLWYLDALGIRKARTVTDGSGVHVCVIDTLVNRENPALVKAHMGASLTLPKAMTVPHGTFMASIIASPGAQGFEGVAPGVIVDHVAVAENHWGEKVDLTHYRSDMVKAAEWCVAQGAKVVNYSMGGAKDNEAVAYLQANDVVMVQATGNYPDLPFNSPPGAFGTLTVSGTVRDLKGDDMSTRAGYHTGQNNDYDLQGVAVLGPSGNRYLTKHPPKGAINGCDGFLLPSMRPGYYAMVCGTSPAAAVVSGVVAMVRAAHPELNAANVVNRIIRTAKKPPYAKPGDPVPSPHYGYGVIDAYAAVTADVPLVDENPLGSLWTGSRGVWDRAYAPQVAEPPVGARMSKMPTIFDLARIPETPVRPNPMPAWDHYAPAGARTSRAASSSATAASPPAYAASSSASAGATSTGAVQAQGAGAGGVPGWAWAAGAAAALAAGVGGVLAMRRSGARRG